MHCLVIYDIPDDKKRSKVADVCLDYGLDRIQFSAFLGDLSKNHQAELMMKVKKELGKMAGKVQLYPLCADDWAARKEIIQEE